MALQIKIDTTDIENKNIDLIKNTLNKLEAEFKQEENFIEFKVSIDKEFIPTLFKDLSDIIQDINIEATRPFYRRHVPRAGLKWFRGQKHDLFNSLIERLGFNFRRYIHGKVKKKSIHDRNRKIMS